MHEIFFEHLRVFNIKKNICSRLSLKRQHQQKLILTEKASKIWLFWYIHTTQKRSIAWWDDDEKAIKVIQDVAAFKCRQRWWRRWREWKMAKWVRWYFNEDRDFLMAHKRFSNFIVVSFLPPLKIFPLINVLKEASIMFCETMFTRRLIWRGIYARISMVYLGESFGLGLKCWK